MIPRNFEALRFGDEHQAELLAKWTGGITYTADPDGVRVSPREVAEGSSKSVASIGDWIIRSADGSVRIESHGAQDGYCADCGKPVFWRDTRLVTRDGIRWCYGPDGKRLPMNRWHALPGMHQYVVPAGTGQVCHCLDRSWPHIHQIVPVPPPQTCGECTGGLIAAGVRCNCDPGPEGQHQPLCGFEPCPNGCWERLHPPVGTLTAAGVIQDHPSPVGAGTLTAFVRYQDCERCNYDTHRCHGCGQPLPHGTELCADCRRPAGGVTAEQRATMEDM